MAKRERTRVLRLDGKPINVVKRRGHLMVCAKGCCCGRTDRGYPAVPIDFYKQEYKRRKIRNRVHLSMNGCLGPCPLANVVLLFFDGRPVWFQSLHTEPQIAAVFDYIERMLAADGFLPPPPELAEYVFDYYTWSAAPDSGRTALPTCSTAAPAPGFLFLTHADTDLLTLRQMRGLLPADFPPVVGISLGKISGPEQMAQLLAEPATAARIVIARLLGGAAGVPGFRRLADVARKREQHLLALSGTGDPDPELAAVSSVDPAVLHEATTYLHLGGPANFAHLLRFLSDHLLLTAHGHELPSEQPQHGIYHPDLPGQPALTDWLAWRDPARPTFGILLYRSHLMSGNLAFVDALVRAIEGRGANALPVFTASLRDCLKAGQPAAFAFLCDEGRPLVDVLISTVSFAMGEVNPQGPTPSGPSVDALARLDVPVLQAICASTRRWQWEASPRGLNPLDTAMNVALPEFDGRIVTVPISFKEPLGAPAAGISDAVHYAPAADRVQRVVGLAGRLAALRRTPNRDKRIAFVLTNAAGKAARIGNAVGLDASASLMAVFEAMQQAGYELRDVPSGGDALIHALIDRCCYDTTLLTPAQLESALGQVSAQQYRGWFAELPETQRSAMEAQWGPAPGTAFVHDGRIALAGLELGNLAVMLQPPRGYGLDPAAIYHQPDLPPTHHYYALYRWLRDVWRADAIVHMGKHGTLEWLPGKSVGLSSACYPDTFLGDLPLFYPFILNDPGEGAQAKRRSHAVIVDHLTPPLTTAEAYGELAQLMQLVDEYYQVELLDPSKMPILQQQIWDLIQKARLQDDLRHLMQERHGDHTHEWDGALTADGTPVSLAQLQGRDLAHLVEELEGYLCELAGAQIRDGLHVLGQIPAGRQLVELLAALTRVPNLEIPSLRGAVAACFDLDLDTLLRDKGARLADRMLKLEELAGRAIVTRADALEAVDGLVDRLLMRLLEGGLSVEACQSAIDTVLSVEPKTDSDHSLPLDGGGLGWGCRPCNGVTPTPALPHQGGGSKTDAVRSVLTFVCQRLVPALNQTSDEIRNLLAGLDGRYVPAGPSGAPTRGMAHVLPTGRNFYAVDPRALPSAAAWQVGQELAREVLERFRRETGSYPETVGLSIWGTSAMRTHGDDVAEICAFLGVRPLWQPENRRVLGVEAIPLAELGRPRIDVTIRISGFFRDAFPHLVQLLDEAVHTVVALDEPPELNFVRKRYLADLATHIEAGHTDAERRARYRIFGSKPGAYGAGLLPLIDERNWTDTGDLAETYVNWGGYAYGADAAGVDARDDFRARLASIQVAVHNQDNREHDLLDSDDYFQFHGGMIAAIRALTGRKPRHYFGDSHDPARPAIRDLQEELLRVFRTRVINPKWLASIMRHGYKGGLELAATVDYLFGYDATTDIVADWMYERVAQAYALDPEVQSFLARSNPWALHAIAERLLEAAQRGLWNEPQAETLDALRGAYLQSETLLEARGERATAPVGSRT